MPQPQQPQWQPMTFLMILFAFLSQNFSRHCSTMACEARLCRLDGKRFSHKTFPACAETFARRCRHLANVQTHRFFSHIFSPDRISQPEKGHQFSYKTFREDEQNAVCTILAYKKRGKYQPGKVMRENPPVLPLSIHNAAKSFLRTAKSILRNVSRLRCCKLKFVAFCGKKRRDMLQTWNGKNCFTMIF